MTQLRQLCERYLAATLSVETAPVMLQMADRHGAVFLRESALKFIVNNMGAVMNTKGFEDLGRCDFDLMLEILKRERQTLGDKSSGKRALFGGQLLSNSN